MNPNVREILADWLRHHGYDGLFNDGVCACSVDELMPCLEPSSECQAGYAVACCECACQDECPSGGDFDYLITEEQDGCGVRKGDADRL